MEWVNKESVLRICEAESEDVAAIISKVKRLTIKCTSEWISVDDSFPEPGEDVLVCNHWGDVDTDMVWINPDGKREFYFDRTNVTHWMPLPEPPKEDAKK